MNSKQISVLVFILALFAPMAFAQRANYVFAYFKNNGEDGLHLAYSRDGLKWKALNEDKPCLTPAAGGEKLMRDPCVILGPDGVFHKDETRNPVKKNLRIAVSRNATGLYGSASPPFSPDWVEGPAAARINNEWVVYFDMSRDHRYGAVKFADLKSWETVTDKLAMPAGARHGSILTVSDAVLSQLLLDWNDCLKQKPEWYAGDEAARVAGNVLLYQRETGGWPKNINMAAVLSEQAKAEIAKQKGADDSLIDNGATYTQMAYLARVFNATGRPDCKEGFIRGLDYLLKAQYENGGWPQYYPRLTGYYKHITYNDDAMVGVLELLRGVARKDAAYSFVDEARRARAENAVARGIEVILKTQIVVNGKRTAWCAQHDEVTLAPAPARSYEHVSLSGLESVGIVRFLMGVEHPDGRIVEAVESAVAWFRESKLSGIKVIEKPDSSLPNGFDRIVVEDASAGPLWARFYEIGAGRPIFSGRDGVIKYSLAEIEHERRTGYGWYTSAPAELLEKDYPAWHAKLGKRSVQRNVRPHFLD